MSNPFTVSRRPLRRSRLAGALGLALGLGVLAVGAGAQALDPGLLAQYQARYVEQFGSLQGFDDFLAAAQAGPSGPPARQTNGVIRQISNCNDSGPGSLRTVLALAQDGDSIYLASCDGMIYLESPLSTSVDNLTINGITPTDGNSGNILWGDDSFRILQHNGTGTLTLSNVTLAHGRMRDGVARGGCVSSLGSVEVNDSVMKYCVADRTVSSTSPVRGGAIYASGGVTISGSSIGKSKAINGYGEALGGGIYAGDGLSVSDADIVHNAANSFGGLAAGGAIYLAGGALNGVTDSYIADNSTSSLGAQRGGGIAVASGAGLMIVQNSVVTGNTMNSANALGGGVFVDTGNSLSVKYSTITHNTAGQGAGLFSRSGLSLKASAVAHNSATVKGGAIIAHSGVVKLESCTIDGNEAPRIGGSELNTTSGEVIRIEQCTIANNRTVEATEEDWGFGTGLVLLKDTAMLNSTITGNQFVGATGSAYGDLPAGGRGTGITLGANVQLEASSSVLMGNWRSLASEPAVWYSDLAAPASSGWGGDHNAVQRGGIGLEPGILPPGNLGLDDAGLHPLADNGGWTWTMLPKNGSHLVNAGLDNGFLWDQRGEPHERVQESAADIGAAESCLTDVIFRNSFEDEPGPPLCAP